MNKKIRTKWTIDILMTAGLLFLMPYELIGREVHEWIGTGMLILFIVHHILNKAWILNLLKGKYHPVRIFQAVLVLLTLLSMLGSMVSGVILSRYVFSFLKIKGAASFARNLHMACAYWGFVFLSLHIGVHWGIVVGKVFKTQKNGSDLRKWSVRIAGVAVAVYGVLAFVKREIGNYMLLRIQFAFFDHEEPLLFFLLDYIAVMGLFVFIGYYLSKCLRNMGRMQRE